MILLRKLYANAKVTIVPLMTYSTLWTECYIAVHEYANTGYNYKN